MAIPILVIAAWMNYLAVPGLELQAECMEIAGEELSGRIAESVAPDRPGIRKPEPSGARELILKRALQALQEQYDPEMYRFSVDARWIPGSLLRMEPGKIQSVQPKGSIDRYTLFEVTAGSGREQTVTEIQLAVEIEQHLPVAAGRILNGEVIREDHLQMRWVATTRGTSRFVEDLEDLTGRTVRRTLADGQPVRHVDVSTKRLVEAGDPVTLIFEDQGIRIELTGEARQDGAEHEEIRIYSNETRRRYVGQVTGPGVAIWKRTL